MSHHGILPDQGAVRRDVFRRAWLEASRTRALIVLGPPMRCLMPADANPFPMFRPFRWLAVEKWVRR
jgi:hypothetical protein